MADITNDVFFASISELSAALRAREFSCLDLTRAFTERFEALAPRYNAAALSLREQAIRQARDVDDEIGRNRLRGPLQGIPYGVKDLIAVAGQPTTWGARPFAGQVFDNHARIVDILNGARAVLIGKLSMIELAGGGNYRSAAASLQGACRNPWDRDRWAGGSSSGSAAAVSAGLVTFAIGSETSGSILTPSAFCGVTGLRPTFGRVSRRGAMMLSWTLDKLGPMCRSAEDCALVLAEIAGNDRDDPDATGGRFYYSPQFYGDPQDITIGYAPVDFEEWAEPAARPAFAEALEVLRSQGYRFKELELPEFPYGAVLSTVLSGESGSLFEEFIRDGRVDQLADPVQIAGLKATLDLPATAYLRAMRVRSLIQEAFREMFYDDAQVLLSPARFGVAPPLREPLGGGGSAGSSRGMSSLIPAGNLCGLPALSLPCGFATGESGTDLPVGLQLVGRPFYESQLISIGARYQAETDWHKRRPPMDA